MLSSLVLTFIYQRPIVRKQGIYSAISTGTFFQAFLNGPLICITRIKV